MGFLLLIDVRCFAAFWSAAEVVFPDINLRGCGFHWSQCIIRKMKSLGLYGAYRSDSRAHDLLRRLLALQFLPKEHIPFALENLRHKSDNEMFRDLCTYVHDTFIVGWHPTNWSNYKQIIRTNNDVEGWHHRLNSR